MCGFTKYGGKEGIKFKDGTFISFDDFSFDLLTENQRKELEEMHIYNEAAIRKRLHEHGNILQNIMTRLDLIDRKLSDISPENNLANYVRKKFKKTSEALGVIANIAKSVGVILAVISLFGYLVSIILEKVK